MYIKQKLHPCSSCAYHPMGSMHKASKSLTNKQKLDEYKQKLDQSSSVVKYGRFSPNSTPY